MVRTLIAKAREAFLRRKQTGRNRFVVDSLEKRTLLAYAVDSALDVKEGRLGAGQTGTTADELAHRGDIPVTCPTTTAVPAEGGEISGCPCALPQKTYSYNWSNEELQANPADPRLPVDSRIVALKSKGRGRFSDVAGISGLDMLGDYPVPGGG